MEKKYETKVVDPGQTPPKSILRRILEEEKAGEAAPEHDAPAPATAEPATASAPPAANTPAAEEPAKARQVTDKSQIGAKIKEYTIDVSCELTAFDKKAVAPIKKTVKCAGNANAFVVTYHANNKNEDSTQYLFKEQFTNNDLSHTLGPVEHKFLNSIGAFVATSDDSKCSFRLTGIAALQAYLLLTLLALFGFF